jgi:hypothetical protein
MLTTEARHHVRIADLDALEQLALQAGDEIDISAAYEDALEALEQRSNLPPEVVLDWGARYLAWARSVPGRDGLPFFGTTDWARRLLQRAVAAGRRELALSVAEAVLASYLPLERERPWWQKQRYHLAATLNT